MAVIWNIVLSSAVIVTVAPERSSKLRLGRAEIMSRLLEVSIVSHSASDSAFHDWAFVEISYVQDSGYAAVKEISRFWGVMRNSTGSGVSGYLLQDVSAKAEASIRMAAPEVRDLVKKVLLINVCGIKL